MTWAAFVMALVGLALWAGLLVVLAGLYGKARPYVQAYAPMISAMMPAAAGTGDVENGTPSSPAALPDRCEYEEHEWSEPTAHASVLTGPAHYCIRCGYVEPLPGS